MTRTKKVAWGKLAHADGPAKDVPKLLKELLGAKQDFVAKDRFVRLDRLTVRGDGGAFSVAPRLVDELLAKVEHAALPHLSLRLVAELAGADTGRLFIHGPAQGEGMTPVINVVEAHRGVVEMALEGDDATAAAACAVVACVPAFEALHDALRGRAQTGSPAVRVAALLALAAVGDADFISQRREDDEPVVAAAATIGWLRCHSEASLLDAREGVATWLSWNAEPDALPFFDDSGWYVTDTVPAPVGRVVAALARRRGDRGREQMLELALALEPDASFVLFEQLGRILLDLGGFKDGGASFPVIPADQLSDEQRAMAEALADCALAAEVFQGMATAGSVRRRWLGLDDPGPLELTMAASLSDGTEGTMPRFQAWWDYQPSGRTREILDTLEGFDRWRALVEWCAGSYGMATYLDDEELEHELEVTSEEGFLERARAVVADVLPMVHAARRARRAETHWLTSALVCLPFLRAEEPIPEEWEVVISFDSQPPALEVLEGLDDEQRLRALTKFVDPLTGGLERLERVFAAVADVATPGAREVIEAAVRCIDDEEYRMDLEAELEGLT